MPTKRPLSIGTYDVHTHTTFSDGRNSVLENARAAEAVGLEAVVIADHIFGEAPWLDDMLLQVEHADSVCNVKVLAGAEATILGVTGEVSISQGIADRLDFVLADLGARTQGIGYDPPASQGRLIANVATAVVNTCQNPLVDAIAHPLNLGRFAAVLSPADFSASVLIEMATAFEETHTAFEIMNQLPWWFPDHTVERITAEYADVLHLFARFGVRFVLGSDAHSCCGVGNLRWCEKVMERAGISSDQLIDIPLAGERRKG